MCLHQFDVSNEVILAFYEKRQNIKSEGAGFPKWYRGFKTKCLRCPQLFISLPPPYRPFIAIEEVKTAVIGVPA